MILCKCSTIYVALLSILHFSKLVKEQWPNFHYLCLLSQKAPKKISLLITHLKLSVKLLNLTMMKTWVTRTSSTRETTGQHYHYLTPPALLRLLATQKNQETSTLHKIVQLKTMKKQISHLAWIHLILLRSEFSIRIKTHFLITGMYLNHCGVSKINLATWIFGQRTLTNLFPCQLTAIPPKMLLKEIWFILQVMI